MYVNLPFTKKKEIQVLMTCLIQGNDTKKNGINRKASVLGCFFGQVKSKCFNLANMKGQKFYRRKSHPNSQSFTNKLMTNSKNDIKISARFSLFFSNLNRWVILLFIFSLVLLYLNHFAPKIIISDFWFKVWMVSENIIYSLIAACIFYFILEVLPKVEAQKAFFLSTLLSNKNL